MFDCKNDIFNILCQYEHYKNSASDLTSKTLFIILLILQINIQDLIDSANSLFFALSGNFQLMKKQIKSQTNNAQERYEQIQTIFLIDQHFRNFYQIGLDQNSPEQIKNNQLFKQFLYSLKLTLILIYLKIRKKYSFNLKQKKQKNFTIKKYFKQFQDLKQIQIKKILFLQIIQLKLLKIQIHQFIIYYYYIQLKIRNPFFVVFHQKYLFFVILINQNKQNEKIQFIYHTRQE
ncbi:hypothetical protein TTHERM_000962199 (macronuclear) [Tetrahymena thermophila SB210]|uniref:Uncharacterized protein n=1 Tax=Tetrahymena thermophila (strain SB210) TaxID=312017 RepID=W7X7S5_TETTS|nr:hypothetical protein TTHERM_000962199 [Tetrahymena thermophila SB210]EWS73392.1 hypothetical protein TTHERM_000962199 [Tetrahymena thermophila SB210]|eukprot:XP_012654082.1 hypothetical protein TTHERM_000962199 [Tetrahymena thermophila SB210]